jgi:DNA recombination protein RmuC
MENLLIYAGIGTVALVAGFILGYYIQSLKNRTASSALLEKAHHLSQKNDGLEERLKREEEVIEDLRQQKEGLHIKNTRYLADLENLQRKYEEQQEEVSRLQEHFTKEFENLANKILDEKSLKFTEQNQKNIKNILTPLQEKIQLFEKKVEESQEKNISIHSALREQLLNLQSQNIKITKEAENLTKALKGDSKMQGNWGELVLERVLEKSNLEKDREYTVQQSFTIRDGTRVLPDVIIHLPDGKKMIIDSKVTLTDYERLVNAEDESERELYLKNHVRSLNKHVDLLSEKKYEDLYNMESPDFVLMFVPIETAFSIAVNTDRNLYVKAFEKNIVIVTPSTLLATLRTIDSLWTNEKQRRNALEIARQAGALYDKFEGFITDLNRVGKKMDEAKGDYEDAMKKLHLGQGNLISRVHKLKKLGAKAKKSIPQANLTRALEDEDVEEPKLEL